jgi:alpha-tubulin suppressor-like RCC1 family protein
MNTKTLRGLAVSAALGATYIAAGCGEGDGQRALADSAAESDGYTAADAASNTATDTAGDAAGIQAEDVFDAGAGDDDAGWQDSGHNPEPDAEGGAPDPTWRDLDAEGSTTCAIAANGAAYCWGHLSSAVYSLDAAVGEAPTQVPGDVEFTHIAVDSNHACAVSAQHEVWCWGFNQHAQLGKPAHDNGAELIPSRVEGVQGAVDVAVGPNHSCALQLGGGVVCWGMNAFVQLGDASFSQDSPTPVQVKGVDSAVEISAGGWHTCARNHEGAVFCWGYNPFGELGHDGPKAGSEAAVVVGLPPATAIAVNGHTTMALDAQGGVWRWGAELELAYDSEPTHIRSIPGATTLDLSPWHTCVGGPSGAQCWGANDKGQLGAGGAQPTEVTESHGPYAVQGLDGASALALGLWHSCALDVEGDMVCWGGNARGELGLGTAGNADPSAARLALTAAQAVRSVYLGACAVDPAGKVWCWGDGRSGRLGALAPENSAVPTPLQGLEGATVSLDLACEFGCAVQSSGELYCWGHRGLYAEQASAGELRLGPEVVAGVSGAVEVVAGCAHACARTATGKVFCIGDNARGQLGQGHVEPVMGAVEVTGLGGPVVALAAGAEHTCALDQQGVAHCWGYNHDRQLGFAVDLDAVDWDRVAELGYESIYVVTTPTSVPHSGRFLKLSAEGNNTCFATEGGAVLCAGIGHGTVMENVATPPTAVDSLAVGHYGGCAAGVGFVRCWGELFAHQAALQARDVRALDISYDGCAITADGGVFCWGDNLAGELGDGWGFRSAPQSLEIAP